MDIYEWCSEHLWPEPGAEWVAPQEWQRRAQVAQQTLDTIAEWRASKPDEASRHAEKIADVTHPCEILIEAWRTRSN